jgi:hypothetical protein
LLFFFPFKFGGDTPAQSSTTTASSTPARWTAITAGALNWVAKTDPRMPRFERVYPQTTHAWGQSVNFAHRIQTSFPLIIQTGNQVLISSTITEP